MSGRLSRLCGWLSPFGSRKASSNIPFQQVMNNSSHQKTDALRTYAVGQSRVLEMNRPTSLNTLNGEMVDAMTESVLAWEQSEACRVILVTGAPRNGKPVFCAGGDVVAMAKGRGHIDRQMGFLAKEYALNHLLGTCKKPVVALMDGVTMGGGAGVSVHGMFRVATENTVFAMPETAIGFIPDVGGTFFLSKLGAFGTYLGLTGARLSGIDVYHARLATHFIPSNRLEDVKASLARGDHSLESINCVLEAFSGSYAPYTMDKLRPVIEECFSKYEVKDIEAAVRGKINSSDDEIAKWATMTLAQLEAASPTALFLTLELLKKARRESLTSCLRNEYAICYQLLENKITEFYEGVDAKLIAKTNKPTWNPPSIAQVSKGLIDKIMHRTKDEAVRNEVTFYSNSDLMDFPGKYCLPTESEVAQAEGHAESRLALMARYKDKMGFPELIAKQ